MTTSPTPEQEAGGTNWAWGAHSPEEARRDQWDALSAQALVYSRRMAHGWNNIKDWAYRPPTSDTWTDWTGAAKWAALTVRYAAVERARDALIIAGPYRCPLCEVHVNVTKNWGSPISARTCVDCWWAESGYDEALDMAREIGRQWKRQQVQAA